MLLFAGPVFMIRCLAGVDVAVDGLEVVEVVASYHHGRADGGKLYPIVLSYKLDHGVNGGVPSLLNSDVFYVCY